MKSQRNVAHVYLCSFLVLVGIGLAYFMVDFYVRSTSLAVINAWLDSEALNFQQGNFLSSVTKSQRIMLSSDVVQGVSLVKIDGGKIIELLQFGIDEKSLISPCEQLDTVNTRVTGLFSYRFKYCFKENPNLQVIFLSKSTIIKYVFLLTVAFIVLSIVVLVYSSLWLQKRELLISRTFFESAQRVSHDIRSPVSALNFAVSKLEDSEHVKLIKSAAIRIEEVAQDLLEKSKGLDSGDQYKKVAHFDIITELNKVVIEKESINPDLIFIDIPDGVKLGYIGIDAKEFKRVLSNLLDNSLFAVSSIPTGRIDISIRAGEGKIQISVIDNGIGISPEDLPFIGNKGVSIGKKIGNGLGLYHCKRVTEQAGGKFDIRSSVGIGTIVTLTFTNKI